VKYCGLGGLSCNSDPEESVLADAKSEIFLRQLFPHATLATVALPHSLKPKERYRLLFGDIEQLNCS
jgi:hypothetical protein